ARRGGQACIGSPLPRFGEKRPEIELTEVGEVYRVTAPVQKIGCVTANYAEHIGGEPDDNRLRDALEPFGTAEVEVCEHGMIGRVVGHRRFQANDHNWTVNVWDLLEDFLQNVCRLRSDCYGVETA